MRSKRGDNEPQDVSYHGNAFLRLMGYIKPYWKTVALCCVLVGLLTVFDIARPRIIGDAIDKYITQQSAQDLPPETRFQGILIAAGAVCGHPAAAICLQSPAVPEDSGNRAEHRLYPAQ